MKKLTFLLLFFFLIQQLSAQFRFDNKLYKTVFWEDLCRTLQQQSGYLLLDVRSPGEFSDTSRFGSLNIGHLKGATNINISQLSDSIGKLEEYKHKPVYVYCSHSQRSRRASRLLSEKGFTNVVNINGGMTVLTLLEKSGDPCLQSIFETKVSYHLLTPSQVCALATGRDDIFLLDVRTDSAFKGMSSEEIQNAFGSLKGSVNIPFAQLAGSLDRVPRNKKIILIDDFGNESVKAAGLLQENKYADVNVLFNGLEEWTSSDPAVLPCRDQLNNVKRDYALISPEEFSKMPSGKDMLILDIRSDSDYNNLSKDYWRNIGRVNQSVNIPLAQLPVSIGKIEQYKNKPVIVYAFSTAPEAFTAARQLTEKGFSQVYVLMGGLFNIRWRAANVKDHAYLNGLVTGIPPDNY